jgi:hypothetical protein
MTLLEDFKTCLDEIAREMNLPFLKLNDDDECQLCYSNDLDIHLMWNKADSLQLHSSLLSTSDISDMHRAFELLLEMNNSYPDMAGGYFGFSKIKNFISYNAVIPLSEVNASLIKNILNNYIDFALHMRSKLMSELEIINDNPNNTTSDSTFPHLEFIGAGIRA